MFIHFANLTDDYRLAIALTLSLYSIEINAIRQCDFFSVCCFLLRLLLLHPYFPHHIVYSLFNLQIGLHFTKCKLSLYSLFCVRVSLCVHPIGNGVTALQSGKSQNSNANEEERANETETLMAIYEKPNESLP